MSVRPTFATRSALRALSAGALALAAGGAGAVALSGPNLKVEFGDPFAGTPVNQDRVDHIAWRASTGEVVTHWVAAGGYAGACSDKVEFFGESSFTPAGVSNAPIGPGTWSRWYDGGLAAGAAKTRPRLSCESTRPPVAVNTRYELPADAARANQMKVVRKWLFDSKSRIGPVSGLRTYVPRLPVNDFHKVMLPTRTGSIVAYDVFACAPFGCTPTEWLGNWYAMEDDFGRGLMVIRDTASATAMPARMDIRFDPTSSSNATSIVIDRPVAGFEAPITETQFLCFYDAISWPVPLRGLLYPAGCGTR